MNSAQHTASHGQSKSKGQLYLVPTPIGNLKDITLRALEVLKAADVIACEDTRTSKKLLNHYEIDVPLVSYHEHNGEQMRPKLLARLQEGQQIALISDAGTPLISDPGYKLVVEAQAQNLRVTPLPGATAITTALCASGLPSDAFAFIGFLPNKEKARQAHLAQYGQFAGTLVAYESPKRVLAALASIQAALGEREVAIARELSKQFEEILRLPVSQLQEILAQRPSIKGEVVLLIAAAEKDNFDSETTDALLQSALETNSTKAAAKQVAAQTGASVSALYNRALMLKNGEADAP